ncbi:MAG: hypothetical protein AAFR56_13075, partial [Chloroflexota bacterium]
MTEKKKNDERGGLNRIIIGAVAVVILALGVGGYYLLQPQALVRIAGGIVYTSERDGNLEVFVMS